MKLNKIIAALITVILLFSLCSCDQLHHHKNNNNQHGQDPNNSETNGTKEEETPINYVYSLLSKTIHLPDCYHVDRIKDDYKFDYNGDLALLFEKGYTICKDCLVPDVEEETPEDDTNKVAKEDATYVINSATDRLHTLDCYHVDNMVEKNIEYTDLTLEELLALEHIPCSVCLPEQFEEYEKNHPEKE